MKTSEKGKNDQGKKRRTNDMRDQKIEPIRKR